MQNLLVEIERLARDEFEHRLSFVLDLVRGAVARNVPAGDKLSSVPAFVDKAVTAPVSKPAKKAGRPPKNLSPAAPPDETMPPFISWFLAKRGLDTVMGRLAAQVSDDKQFPGNADVATMKKYLEGSDDYALDTKMIFEAARREYSRQVKKLNASSSKPRRTKRARTKRSRREPRTVRNDPEHQPS